MADERDSDSRDTVETLAESARQTNPKSIYDSVQSLPGWWKSAVREFETNDLRVYQPSQFEDGIIVPDFINRMESKYEVTVRFMSIDPRDGDNWGLYVDGEKIRDVPHRRIPDGHSVYGIDSEEVEICIMKTVE